MKTELKSANSVKTGKQFAEKRIELGLTIEDVSKILYVNKNYLSAIENGNYSIFPSESFAKAYFKKYIKFLKLDIDFPNLFPPNPKKKYKKIFKEINFENSFFKNLKYFIFLIIGLGIGILFFFFLFLNTVNDESLKNNNFDEISILVESIEKNKLELRKTKEEVDLNKLVLKFEGECWLEIYINDQLIEAQLFYDGDKYIKEIITPFKIIVGNADSVKGSYNNDEIDFITNANRLTKVNIINFTNE